MKATVYSVAGEKISEVDLPPQFSEEIRPDLIKRAVLAVQSTRYQPKGADPRAGTRQGHTLSKRRRRYKGSYGSGRSRIRRKYLWRRGGQFYWVGAFVASAVKGRKAFPPKSEKITVERINTKEKRKAIRSAIAAAASLELVGKKHLVNELKQLPIVVEDAFEKASKTKEVARALNKLGLGKELQRAKQKKIRAGRGKMRGRKYRRKTGPLIVVGKNCSLLKSARNIPGVNVSLAKNLNAELLAPGAQAGRLTIWTQSALKELEGGLFK